MISRRLKILNFSILGHRRFNASTMNPLLASAHHHLVHLILIPMSDWPPGGSNERRGASRRGQEEHASTSRRRGASSSGNLGQVRVRDEDEILCAENPDISQLVQSISPNARDVYIVWIDGKTSGFTNAPAFPV
jgi:hypothetical protein